MKNAPKKQSRRIVRLFFGGMARTFDLFGAIHETTERRSSRLSDYEAMRKDWENIGKDMRRVLNGYGR